ncbi:MAG: hypothetical protein WA106_09055, partial [Methanothrix sp.]
MKGKIALAIFAAAMLCVSALAQENTANYWFEKSDEHLKNGSIEEADLALDKALQLDPQNASIWLSKALTLELLSKGNESQEVFQKSLSL